MKILITGATGFIGKHLLTALSTSEHEVLCAIRKSSINEIKESGNIHIQKVDFDDKESLRQYLTGIDTVIHLAGQMGGYGIPYETFYHTNCELTQNLLDSSISVGVKHFIYCSTPGVLGFGKRLAEESEPYAPRNPYEQTKVTAEKIVIDTCTANSGIHYTIVRPDFVYGPGDIRRVKMYRGIKNRRFVLTTSGESYLHPTYIDDVVSGFMCCIGNENSYDDIFNIAAKSDVTSKEYLEIIAACTDTSLIQINIGTKLSRAVAGAVDFLFQAFLHKEGFVSKNKIDFLSMDHSSCITHAEERIGYVPQYSCQQGIKKTIEWCKKENLL